MFYLIFVSAEECVSLGDESDRDSIAQGRLVEEFRVESHLRFICKVRHLLHLDLNALLDEGGGCAGHPRLNVGEPVAVP